MSIAKRLQASWSGVGDRVLVLSHGFGSDQTSWDYIRPTLDPHFRVLSYSLAGCGDAGVSSYDAELHGTLFGYADDLLALIDELRLREVSYVGHSVSGMIGMIAAAARPELFARLVLLQPSPRYLNDAATGYAGGFEQLDLDALYAAMKTNYQSWAAGFVPMVMGVDDRHVLARFSTTLFKMRPDIALDILRMIFQSDHRDLVPRVTTPVHLIHSRKDVAVPLAVADWLRVQLPHSVSEILELEGHLPHLTQPAIVATSVQRHLLAD
ncbi:alpha/beta fold hydrolase [Duganella vulcania]|uniref:Alpha/beta fold hydrolase n=1 Tax=Duganella vulcania TaxID=2692166 RepID=A0A845GF18_9BURK|nr:alpha/beta hydrolase [Duganella vulcania]MYM92511.1 alpha/beta fold hydrolase [Duganella vulcania]